MKEIALQLWMNSQTVADEMLWKGSWGRQLQFFRDRIVPMFCAGLYSEEREGIATVISTHRSKSIELPVYKLHRPDIGLTMVFRDNFYNWKVSVFSEKPVNVNFMGLAHTTPPIEPNYTGNPLAPVYFEGFPREWIFGYYSENQSRFSLEIQSDYELWAAMYLMLHSLGVLKDARWHTEESHRKELAAHQARFDERRKKRASETRLIIHSSHGDFRVSQEGTILQRPETKLRDVTMFHVEEFLGYARTNLPRDYRYDSPMELDILEIGFWFKNDDGKEVFQEPDDTFRENAVAAYRRRVEK